MRAVGGPFQDDAKFVHIHRLAEEIAGALTHGAQGMVLFPLPRHHDDLDLAVVGEQVGKRGEAFNRLRGAGRKTQVQQHDRRPGLTSQLQRGGPIARDEQFVIVSQRPFQLRANLLVIIDN